MHLENQCPMKMRAPFTINVLSQAEREKLANLGQEIAVKKNVHFEGYILDTQEPYALDHAKATLFFD